MITLSRILSVCVWQFSEVGNGLTRAWQKCIFFFHLLYICLLFTYIFLCIDHGRTALLRYVEWTLFLRWKPLSSFLRKSVCFQTLQPRGCLFKNDVASFVNPVFSKIPGCRNYMPKFCRFGIIAISRTAATWKLNSVWVIERGNGELKTERSTW